MSQCGLGHLQCPCRPKGATYKTTEHISDAHELGHLQCPCRPKDATYKTTEHISGAHELGRLQRPCRPEDATYMGVCCCSVGDFSSAFVLA